MSAKMLKKKDRFRLKKLLAEAVPLLCKNGLGLSVESSFCVEAMIGITVDDRQVAIICFKESLLSEGTVVSEVYGVDDGELADDTDHMGNAAVHRITSQFNSNDDNDCQFVEDPSAFTTKIKYEHQRSVSETAITREKEMPVLNGDEYNNFNDSDDLKHNIYYDDDINRVQQPRKTRGRSATVTTGPEFCVKQERCNDEQETQYEEQPEDNCNSADWESYSQNYGNTQPQGKSSGSNFEQFGKVSKWNFGRGRRERSEGGRAGRRWGTGRTRPTNVRLPWSRQQSNSIAPTTSSLNSTVSELPDNQGNGGQGDMLKILCRTIASQSQVEQQFICHICNAKLATRPSLVTHIKGSHLATRVYQCDQCPESFNWYMQLYRHKKRAHSAYDYDLEQDYPTDEQGGDEAGNYG